MPEQCSTDGQCDRLSEFHVHVIGVERFNLRATCAHSIAPGLVVFNDSGGGAAGIVYAPNGLITYQTGLHVADPENDC